MIQDEEFSQAVEADEFNLVDDYATRTLPRIERKQLAAWLNSSLELRTRVLIAQHLHRSNRSLFKSRAHGSWWIAGIAATCLILLTLSIFPRHTTPLPQTAHTAMPRALPAPPQQDTVLLIAERQRDNAAAKQTNLYTVHRANAVRLQILIPSSAGKSEYSGWLRSETKGRGLSLNFSAVSPRDAEGAPYVELNIPPGTLRSDRYALQLQSRAGTYDLSFRVEVK